MQAEYLKRRFEIKDDLHRLISGIELSRDKELYVMKYFVCDENCIQEEI